MIIARVGVLALAVLAATGARAEPMGSPFKAPHGLISREAMASARFVAKIEGVYFRYEHLHEREASYDAESTMEIVPYGRGEAYVRMRTAWGNHHSCSLYAVFKGEADALVHEGLAPDGRACRMRIALEGGTFMTSARDQKTGERLQACIGSCGARGSFDDDDRFALRQRRPIRYMRRLLDSDEYAAAIAHREGRIAEANIRSLDDLRRKAAEAGNPATSSGEAPGELRRRDIR